MIDRMAFRHIAVGQRSVFHNAFEPLEESMMSVALSLPPGDRVPPDHPPPHHGPVESAGVWYGRDLRGSDEWHYVLDAEERRELLAATEQAMARGGHIQDIRQEDFPLPTLAATFVRLRREIVRGRGFVLVRDMPIEGLSFPEQACMYWGMGTYFGSARSQNTRGHLLGHVTDISAQFENKSDRGYLTARHLPYHCDSVDVVGLMCLRKAKEGGLSSVVSSYTIHNEIWARRPDLAPLLYGPVPRDRRDEIPEGKGPWYELPVFNFFEGRLAINFLRKHIDTSQRHPDAFRISEALSDALDLVHELANDPELHLQMAFEPGDVQLLHNHQMLHSRTAYDDWDDPEHKRYLLRLWLAPPDGIPLPDAFAGRYRSVTIGARGGVAIPGMKTVVPLTAM